MPYIPQMYRNEDLTAETLNTIGADIGVGVTVVKNSLDTLHNYGQVVLGTSVMQNAFIHSLMNRIALVKYTSDIYRNPLARLKKGILNYGETVEEIFVPVVDGIKELNDISVPSDPFDTSVPDVRTVFHLMNVECKYPTTVRPEYLSQAFTGFSGVDNFMARCVEALYTSQSLDEELLTKYKIGQAALQAIEDERVVNMYNAEDTTAKDKAERMLEILRTYAKLFDHEKADFNHEKVFTHTRIQNLITFLPADVEAKVDVRAFAAAFNLQYEQFIGQKISLDSFLFTDAEKARLEKLFGWNPGDFATKGFTAGDEAKLKEVRTIICDERLLQIYDVRPPKFTENYNGSDDTWNYWLHIKQTYSLSPFVNCIVIKEATV